MKEEFLQFINDLMQKCPEIEPSENVKQYLKALEDTEISEKVAFTENGKLILGYMQNCVASNNLMLKSRDIAEGLGISSRGVSGAMRKLVTDGYVEKMGQNPIIYMLTEKGKELILE